MSLVLLTLEYFPDPTRGVPVFNGHIYIGEPSTDPEIPGNQKTVTLRQSDGTETPALQPIRTGAGGVALLNGSPVQMLVDGNYSLLVQNEQAAQVYYIEDALGSAGSPLVGSGLLLTGLRAITLVVNGGLAITSGRLAYGDNGGGTFYWDSSDLSTEVTADTQSGIYVAPDSDQTGASGAWVRRFSGAVNVRWFGAAGDGSTDDTSAINAALTLGEGVDVFLPAGTYLTTDALAIKSNTWFHGVGDASIIKSVSMVNGGSGIGQRQVDATNKTGWKISSLYFNYGGLAVFLAGSRCISAIESDNYNVSNCLFDTPGAAVASIGCHTYTIENNRINTVSSDGVKHHDGVIDQWDGSHTFRVNNNIIYGHNISHDMILVTGSDTAGGPAGCYNFSIVDNKLINSLNVGILVNGRSGHNYNFSISNNSVDSVTDFFGIGIADSYSFTVEANRVQDVGKAGIQLYKEPSHGDLGTHDFVVANNIVERANTLAGATETTDSSILIKDVGIDGVVTGNRIKGTLHRRGIYLGVDTVNVVVADNNSDVSAVTPTTYDLGTDNYISYKENSDTYIPALTNTSNISTSTASSCRWAREGSIVTVNGRVVITPASGGDTITQLGIALPVVSNFNSVANDLAGVGSTTGALSCAIHADIANDRAVLQFPSPDAVAKFFYFSFQYTVK